MKKINKSIIDAENNLTTERINKLLSGKTEKDFKVRPRLHFVELINWAREEFAPELTGKEDSDLANIIPVINNTISIDGPFVQFCELNSVNIIPREIDSIASWETESNTESFMVQGVFLIESNGLKFIHAAVFQKGNQFEDEISYFILVERKNYMKYVEFRNKFMDWQNARLQQTLEVKVFGGENYSYSGDCKWKDLYLPSELKDEIKESFDSFFKAKNAFIKNKLPWKRGVLLYGPPGNGKTTLINTILSEYPIKPITVNGNTVDDYILTEAFKYAEENGPSLLFLEDVDLLFKDGIIDMRHFINLMDGINAINGVIIIATTNNPSKLKKNLVDRPSRFDRKWEIPIPDETMTAKYLRKWFKASMIDDDSLLNVIEITTENDFSYAYLKELYISSMFSAMATGRDAPSIDDINKAIQCLLKEKKIADSEFVSSKSKKFGF